MAFESIGDVGAHLMLRISSGDFPLYEERTGEQASAVGSAQPAARRGEGFVATSPTGEEGTIEPVAFASKGVPRETQKKKARASVRAKVPSPLDATRNGSDGVAGMDMATVRPKSERPRSAVVISMLAWKAERRVHVTPSPLRGRG